MKNQRHIAVYAGTFDPVTLGHLWMIEKGATIFDKLVVAVGTNPDKKCYFPLEERILMIRESITRLSNVTVDAYQNQFLIKYVEKIGARFLLRGIRSTADYEYEKSMSYINRDQNSDIVTLFLLPPRDLIEISSSIVRGLIGPEGWEKVVSKYVPPGVLERLESWVNKTGLTEK